MKRNRQENDPSRDRNSRIDRVADDMGDNTDLGQRQSEGNLGNERTRNREDEGTRHRDDEGTRHRGDEGDRSDRRPERSNRGEKGNL